MVFDLPRMAVWLDECGVAFCYPPANLGAESRITAVRDPDGNPVELTHLAPGWPDHLKVAPRIRGSGLLALGPSQPVRGSPPLDDEHHTRLIEAGVHHLGDLGAEAVADWSLGDRSGGDRPAGDLRLAWPLSLGALDRVDRGTVQREPRIAAEIRALARVRHGAEYQLAVLEDCLDAGDSRRSVGPQGGKRLVSMSVE